MYLTFDQVILIRDKSKVRLDDPLVYVVHHPIQGRVLIMDEGFRAWGEPYGYGHIYEDASGDLCVVPHIWNEDDTLLAKSWQATFDS